MGSSLKTFINLIQKKNPEIMETIESDYTVARRVYQHPYYDIAELFFEYV